MLQGFQKSTRIRDLNVGNCLTVGEIRDFLYNFERDAVLVLKCNNKNFRIADYTIVKNKPIIIGKR